MEYLALISSVAVINLLACMSPGPDFIICARNSLAYSRKTGIYTAIGFGLGYSVHAIISTIVLWFSFVAVCLTQKRIRAVFERFQNIFNKTLGGLLILLGIKVAVSEK